MGLAERFASMTIGKENIEEKNLILKPVEIQSKVIEIDTYKKFEDLESDTINKIRKTPYWHDYPLKSQESMIEKYFDSKIKSRYSDINYTTNEKIGFIKNVITLVNS